MDYAGSQLGGTIAIPAESVAPWVRQAGRQILAALLSSPAVGHLQANAATALNAPPTLMLGVRSLYFLALELRTNQTNIG